MAVIGEAFIAVRPDSSRFGPDAEKGVIGSVTNIAKKAAAILGGAFALQKGTEFVKDVTSAASDLAESQSKVNVVFGEFAPAVSSYSKAADAIGLSDRAALEATGTFGNLFTALGLSREAASKLSPDVVSLGADLASFNNLGVDEALEKLRSGLVGEAEPLRSLGVALTEGAVAAKAVELGLAKSTSEVSESAKVQARFALIMEQTKNAQGDFARTSDGLANKQRILAARFDDIKAALGARLLPVITSVTSLLADNLPNALDVVTKAISPVVKQIGMFVNSLRTGFTEDEGTPIERIALRIRAVFEAVIPLVEKVVKFIGEHLVGSIQAVVVAFGLLAGPIAGPIALLALLYARFQVVRDVVAAVVSAVGGFVDFFRRDVIPVISEVAQGIAEQFSTLVVAVSERMAAIQEAIGHVLEAIKVIVGLALAPIILAWKLFGDQILQIVGIAFEQIRNVVDTAIRIIRDVIDVVLAVINGDWGAAWNALKDIPAAILGFIVESVGNAMQILSTVVSRGVELAVGFIAGIPGRLIGLVGGILSAATRIGSAIMDGIGHGLSAAVGFAGDVASSVLKAIKNLINKQVVDRLNDGIPDSLGAGPFKISLPKNPIPRLAKGAIVQRRPGGIIANIAEGATDEAVLPLPPGLIEGLQAIAAMARAGQFGAASPLVGQIVFEGIESLEAAETNASAVVRRLRSEAFIQGK